MFGMFKRQRAHAVAIENGPVLQIQAGETLLNGALRHEVDFPFSCKVGGCSTCKCQLVSDEPAGNDWPGLRGMVSDHLFAEIVTRSQAYLCTLGMNKGQIFSDKFSDQRNAP